MGFFQFLGAEVEGKLNMGLISMYALMSLHNLGRIILIDIF
jgi:hypothetical protein